MSKQVEALKLAQDLRVLADRFSEGWHDGIKIDASDILLLSDAAEALTEQQPAQQQEPVACTHGWFKTGAMAPGEMRCIHCGEWRAIEAAHGIKGDA